MSFSFENQKVSCYCNSQGEQNRNYSGLISSQSAKEKYNSFHHKESFLNKMKDKKVSLKTKKNPSKQSESSASQTQQSPFPQPKNDYFSIINDKQGIEKPKQPPRQSNKETRTWMEKKKTQIQIQSIGRVPTKELYEHKKEFFTYNTPKNNSQKFLFPPTFYIPSKPVEPKKNNFIQHQKFHQVPSPVIHQDIPIPVKNPQKHFTHHYHNSELVKKRIDEEREDQEQRIFSLKREKKLIPKEIESVIDEDEYQEDNMSEVLGHGWESSSEKQDDKPTKTIVTITTNDRNSQIKNSLGSKIIDLNKN